MACVILPFASAGAQLLEQSVSSSRQFIVYGVDPGMRGGVCDLAERTKKNLLTLLQQRDDWKTPIVVHAEVRQSQLPDAPAARLHVSQTGFGLKLQLDLAVDADADPHAIQRELLRTILIEKMYRDAPDTPAGAAYVEPPDWILDGALALGSEKAAVPEAVATLAAEDRIIPLRDFLQQRPETLEHPSRAVYRACAAGLLSMLFDLPDGRARFAKFLSDLTRGPGDHDAALHACYPELGKDLAETQRSWMSTIARLTARERYRMMNCEETERRLARLLTVEIPAKDQQTSVVYGLDDFPKFIALPAAPAALSAANQQLLLLSGSANPLYGRILANYHELIARLARRKTGKVAERLAKLKGEREDISRRMSAIDDYMNWFEATHSRTASGVFADYMRAAEAGAERQPRRHDAISVYLDTMEAHLVD